MPLSRRALMRRARQLRNESKLVDSNKPTTPSLDDAPPIPIPEIKLTPEQEEAKRKQEWENKFKEYPVIYNAQDGRPRDVRTFIFDRSYILEDVVKRYRLKGATDDETMQRCCIFVQDYIKYVGDQQARNQPEYWQNPEDTVSRGAGDCEDGAILMKSLSLIAGVPDWKCKIVAGHVRGGGHAYCTYICADDRQVIMDWCYWPVRLGMDKRKTINEDERYGEVWFSFTYSKSYSGKSVAYKNGQIAIDGGAMGVVKPKLTKSTVYDSEPEKLDVSSKYLIKPTLKKIT